MDLLFEAISIVKDSVGEYLRLLMVGDGPEVKLGEDFTEDLGISELVTFTGRIPHYEVTGLYSVIISLFLEGERVWSWFHLSSRLRH